MRHTPIDRGTERKKTAFARFLHINGSIVEDSTRAQNKKNPPWDQHSGRSQPYATWIKCMAKNHYR